MPEYEDFDLRLERREGREYTVTVLSSPAGQAESVFFLPFSAERLDEIGQAIDDALLRSLKSTRRLTTPELETVREFGRELFDALFRDRVRACYEDSYTTVRKAEKGLRLKLRLDPTLAGLPWEFMYSDVHRDFVALSGLTPLVRYSELKAAPPFRVTPPLRILVVVTSPIGYAPLDVEKEKERIGAALSVLQSQGIVEAEFLEAEGRNTDDTLQQRLWQSPFHVLHFIGHGIYDQEAKEGFLLVEDEERKGRLVTGQDLGRLLRGHPSMRLLFLNACQGAQTSSADPFSGVAAEAVLAGIPAVVAMQFEISDPAAIVFSQQFYLALADGYPIDAAVSEARLAMTRDRINTIEWATPVLFMSTPDGVLFDLPELSGDVRERVIADTRRQQELADLRDQVVTAMLTEQWPKALDLLERIQAIEPGYRDTETLRQRVQEKIAAQQRSRRRRWLGTALAVAIMSAVILALLMVAGPWRGGPLTLTLVSERFADRKGNVRSIFVNSGKDTIDVWVAIDGEGVLRYDGEWTPYSTANKRLPTDYITDIAIDREGGVWLGTEGLGVIVLNYDGKTVANYTKANSGLAGDVVSDVAIDQVGRKWFSVRDGNAVSMLDANDQWKIFKPGEEGPFQVEDIAIEGEDIVWFATSQGLRRLELGKENWTIYNKENTCVLSEDCLLSDIVWTIYIDEDGRKWLGTGSGLNMLDDHGAQPKWVSYTEDGLPANTVTAIAPDDADHLFIGTTRGLSVLEEEKVIVHTIVNGPKESYVSAIAFDRYADRLWLGTLGSGLSIWVVR